MAAPGDESHKNGRLIGDNLYKSTVKGQEGAIIIIVDRSQLPRCFPGKNIAVGKFGYDFNGQRSWHWVISYTK
jgi:hypothetical protein